MKFSEPELYFINKFFQKKEMALVVVVVVVVVEKKEEEGLDCITISASTVY
jgi:hypothetical protein